MTYDEWKARDLAGEWAGAGYCTHGYYDGDGCPVCDAPEPIDIELEQCALCDAEYMGPPVTAEEQRWYLGFEYALRFCSVSCLDNAAEAYGVRQAERSLQ